MTFFFSKATCSVWRISTTWTWTSVKGCRFFTWYLIPYLEWSYGRSGYLLFRQHITETSKVLERDSWEQIIWSLCHMRSYPPPPSLFPQEGGPGGILCQTSCKKGRFGNIFLIVQKIILVGNYNNNYLFTISITKKWKGVKGGYVFLVYLPPYSSKKHK